MATPIEDLALIGDLHTTALVSRGASILWLCLPSFDSDACFAALLGDESNGCWTMTPQDRVLETRRRYRGETLILETTMRTVRGSVRIVDFMPRRDRLPTLVRIVEGVEGTVAMRTSIAIRFQNGVLPPWTRPIGDAITFTVGENGAVLRSSVKFDVEKPDARCTFEVKRGDRIEFVMQWYPSYEEPPKPRNAEKALSETERLWSTWSAACKYKGAYRDAIVRSLITLKALTYEPSGGCVAAATTSLPEQIGGSANWDYRYAWIRDSALTIDALVPSGYLDEARAWRDWLLRALAGAPDRLQIMYTPTGHGRIAEYEVPWLKGYEDSRPVRIGNAAFEQFQLGIYGQLMSAIVSAHEAGIEIDGDAWSMLAKLLEFVELHWREGDFGIWEYRDGPKFYTQSRILAWLAFDRAIYAAKTNGYEAPMDRWNAVRERIFTDVCEHGFDPKRNTFTMIYGGDELDAALLVTPIVGFLPIDDPRVQGTIAAIESELMVDGLLARTTRHVQQPQAYEGSFFACDFWLVHVYALAGRMEEARELFGRLMGLGNDLGLFSEEYDTRRGRLVGNFPQTFSHATLVNAALALDH